MGISGGKEKMDKKGKATIIAITILSIVAFVSLFCIPSNANAGPPTVTITSDTTITHKKGTTVYVILLPTITTTITMTEPTTIIQTETITTTETVTQTSTIEIPTTITETITQTETLTETTTITETTSETITQTEYSTITDTETLTETVEIPTTITSIILKPTTITKTKFKTEIIGVPTTITKEFHYLETITKTFEKLVTLTIEKPVMIVKEETKTTTSPVAIQTFIPQIPYEVAVLTVILAAIALGSLTALVAKRGKEVPK